MYNIWRDGVYRDDPAKSPYQNAALSSTYARQGITNSKDNDNSSVTTTNYHYANGNAIGRSGQNDKGASEVEFAQGDFGLVKHLGDRFPTSALSSFTATGGETLRQVAGMLLGNSNLWFILAEANGRRLRQPLAGSASPISATA